MNKSFYNKLREMTWRVRIVIGLLSELLVLNSQSGAEMGVF